jgi:hypothetical protein
MSVDLSDMTVGDAVFVVLQKRRNSPQDPGFTAIVTSVGRKYATCQQQDSRWKRDFKFDRKTGVSVHEGDCNQRCNGFGWDVYRDESSYQKQLHEWNRLAELNARLDAGYRSCLKTLPADAVEAIHAILDQHK